MLCPPCIIFFRMKMPPIRLFDRLLESTGLYPILVCIFIWRFFYIYDWFFTKYSLGKSFLVVTKVIMRPNLGSRFLSSLFEKIFYFHLIYIYIYIYILESCEAQQRDWFLFLNRNLFSSSAMSYQCWHLEPCKATCLCG
jgi:hypothetical protein